MYQNLSGLLSNDDRLAAGTHHLLRSQHPQCSNQYMTCPSSGSIYRWSCIWQLSLGLYGLFHDSKPPCLLRPLYCHQDDLAGHNGPARSSAGKHCLAGLAVSGSLSLPNASGQKHEGSQAMLLVHAASHVKQCLAGAAVAEQDMKQAQHPMQDASDFILGTRLMV